MKHTVVVLPQAKDDLFDIFIYTAQHHAITQADAMLDGLEEKFISLSDNPQRGHAVPELKRIHVESFREIHYKPYRIIFQISDETVYIHAVLDGRRELQELLENRIIR
jgi:toxin ParE1/3/4